MGSLYSFDRKVSYFNDYSFRGSHSTEGVSLVVQRSTLTNEAGGDSFTHEAAGTTTSSYAATRRLDRTGFTLHEATTLSASGTQAGTSSYEGGFSEEDSSEGTFSVELRRTRIQNTTGATFSSYDENQAGVVVDVTGLIEGAGEYLSFSSERRFTALGSFKGETYEAWFTTQVPVTVESVSWFTTFKGTKRTTSSSTFQGLHEITSYQSVASFDFQQTTSQFTSSFVSYSVDGGSDNKKGFFEARLQGQELWTAHHLIGVGGEKGLWIVRPPVIPSRMNDLLERVGEWQWSKQGGAGVTESSNRAQWEGEGLVTYEMDQLPFSDSTSLASIELRKERTLNYNYVEDGKLKKSSSTLSGSTFVSTVLEGVGFSTSRVPATELTTCPGIFLVGDGFTQRTVSGSVLRFVATYSIGTFQTSEPVYAKGNNSSSSLYEQEVEGASIYQETQLSEQINGDRTPKSWTSAMPLGFVSEVMVSPVCFIQGRARGYLPFHFQGGEPGQLYREAGGNLLSTSGELTKVFGTGELAPCSDMVGEAGRSRLDPPCRCSSLTLEKINDASTVGIPFWSAVSYSTSRELWVVFESKLFKSTETFQRSSYQSGTTTAHPLETFTLHREWLPDTKTSAAARSFAFTVEGPNLLKKYGTIGVTLAGRVDPGGECWYSTQPQDSIIFASAKGILWWAGACLEATLVRGNGRPAMREATQAGEGARTIAFDGQAMRYQTTPMLALAPGGDLVYHNVTAAQDASHWPMFLIESATA